MGFIVTGGVNFSGGSSLAQYVESGDPYFNYTTLLLPGNGTNGGTNNTFLDGSTNNFTVTRNGSATQGTVSPYSLSSWSNYFNGSSDFLYLGGQSNFAFGSNNFTIECWAYISSNNCLFYDSRPLTTNGAYFAFGVNSSSQLSVYVNGADLMNGGSVSLNSWTHFAVSRSGSTLRGFINGTLVATATDNNSYLNGANRPIIAANGYVTNVSNVSGYISNLRVLNGTALYTASFTVPTAPLTAIANTVLLTCQSNAFKDNSTNTYTINVSGNSKVATFNPFLPTTSYVAGTNGGSGYFNGVVGDWLSLAGTSAFAIATSTTPFTIESWIYPTAAGGCIFSEQYTGSGNSISITISMSTGTTIDDPSGRTIAFGWYSGSAWTAAAMANTTVPLNAWTHVACVFTGSTTKIYLNGVDSTKSSSPTPSTTWGVTGANGDAWYVARRWDNGGTIFFSGYISDLRFVNGTAVYTTNFTPPTAPLTAIANTKLLLNFTNATIIDQTCNNNLVGNVYTSTTQSKFGGSSMYFNSADLTIPGNQTISGDFTIESWIYLTSLASTSGFFKIGNENNGRMVFYIDTDGSMKYNQYGSASYPSFGGAFTTNQWYHVAIVRSGTTVTCYKNGTSTGTQTISGTLGNSSGGYIQPYLAYYDDYRITIGYARYTSNFTAPTAAFPTY